MWRTVLLIFSGSAGASLLTLARNLIIARAIGVEAFGVAATFAIVMTMIEMTSTMGLQQQIVQSQKGDEPDFQAALQGFHLLRGCIAAIAMFAIAEPLARFLGIPEVAWGYQLMALMPILTALVHFDIYRLNRQMIYRPGVISVVMPALIALISVPPLLQIFGDWRVMLYSILLQGALLAIVSHLVAERPYRLALKRGVMAEGLRFGWPILLNGALMFLVFNGERLLVGRELGVAMLGLFSMAVTLAQTPTLIAGATAQRFFLPQLSALGPDGTDKEKARFAHLARAAIEVDFMIGALLVLGALVLGGPLVGLLLGPSYANVVPLLVPLAVVQAIRIAKMGGSTATLARGYTGTMLPAHLIRAAGLPIAWLILVSGGSVMHIIALAALTELVGIVVALIMVRARLDLSLRPLLPSATLLSLLLISALMAPAITERLGPVIPAAICISLTFALGASCRELRHYLNSRRFDGFGSGEG